LSGVLVMHDEARQALGRLAFPAVGLVWLAISPVLSMSFLPLRNVMHSRQ
jgi:hypothetical protein